MNFTFLLLSFYYSVSRGDRVHLLWVRCRESLSFISNLPVPVHIVEKCENGEIRMEYPPNVISTITTPNLGDEAVGYLRWIVLSYMELPRYTIFAHGEHLRSFLPLKTLLKCMKEVDEFPTDGYFQLNSGAVHYYRRRTISDDDLTVKKAAKYQHLALQNQGIKNFPNLENSTLHTYWGATWLISSTVLKRWPRKFYEACYQAAVNMSIPQVSKANKRTLYNMNAVPGKYRHTEIGGFYEHSFYVILNGGSIRNKRYQMRDFENYFHDWCIPYPQNVRKYRRKYRKKFKPELWEKYIEEKYPQKF